NELQIKPDNYFGSSQKMLIFVNVNL
ncbi:hypothetical protein EZS27_020955, partial [termite gut metagenome]